MQHVVAFRLFLRSRSRLTSLHLLNLTPHVEEPLDTVLKGLQDPCLNPRDLNYKDETDNVMDIHTQRNLF